MKIGGFLKQSLIDYPGNIASVVFTSGCNFRCFYCHNPELVLPELVEQNNHISENEILDYVKTNSTLLDAVVISGGEPTIHKDLPAFLQKIKQLNLLIKLDTNGTNPDMINVLLQRDLIDYIAMDIKAPLITKKYQEIIGDQFTFLQLERILESIYLIKQSKIKYEFRTTLVKPNHSIEDIRIMSEALSGNYYLQEFNSDKTLACTNKNSSFQSSELTELIAKTNPKLKLIIR